MTEVLHIRKCDCESLVGTFIDKESYDVVLDEDVDVYVENALVPNTKSEADLVLKFRKRWFNKSEQANAYDGLKEAAKSSQNRGMAAGTRAGKLQGRDWVTNYQLMVLDNLADLPDNDFTRITEKDLDQWRSIADNAPTTRGLVWLSEERIKHDFDFDTWIVNLDQKSNTKIKEEVKWINNTLVSATSYANPVDSGVAGWFGRYPRIPYGRATSYTRDNAEKFTLAYPFLQSLSNAFAELIPGRFQAQMDACKQIDRNFLIPGTPFSTITVNKNFRTAAHRDAGDFTQGFSNLTVVARDKDYTGGQLILPEIRAAVNIRPGDLLLVGNHEFIHGNTPIIPKEGHELERISLVCYLREDMLKLGSYEYETIRYEFVEKQRHDKTHPAWFNRFNGVTSGMWDSKEWYDYLRERNVELLTKYHPESAGENSLEQFFV